MADDQTAQDVISGGVVGEILLAILNVIGDVFTLPPAAAAGSAELVKQASMQEKRPTLLTPPELMEAMRRNEITLAQWQNALSRHGYTPEAQRVMARLSEQLLDVSSLTEAWRRGNIGDAEYDQRLEAIGFNAEARDIIRSLIYYLPPVQDVIRFAVREVFTPEVRARFGQDEGFPEAVLPLSRQLGVRDEDMRNYWAAHWELPSPQQGFEMLHRSAETGATDADLDTLLRALDIMPFWREKLKAIAYNPITRVDIRRLHKLGLLNHEQLVDRYRRIGYNPQDAELLAQFTEKLNATDTNSDIEPWRSNLRSHVLSLYESWTIGEAEAEQELKALGYSDAEAQAFTAGAEFIREAAVAKKIRAQAEKLYVSGYWTLEHAVTRLVAMGFSDAEINAQVSAWELEKELKDDAEHRKAERDLTKAEIIGAYTDGIYGVEDATKHLRDMGYSADEAEVLLARADIAKGRADRSELEKSLHTLFTAGRVTEADARSQLGAAGVNPARIDTLIQRWSAEHIGKTPQLNVQQISRALAKGIIDPAEADRRFYDLGYSAPDREILLALAGEAPAGSGV